jgi:16S rRNA (adenine(1408)-N(1))-methyltransferase
LHFFGSVFHFVKNPRPTTSTVLDVFDFARQVSVPDRVRRPLHFVCSGLFFAQSNDKMEEIMEIVQGKMRVFMDADALDTRLEGYDSLHIDIGTGDGRYVQHLAQTGCFAVGIDACRENMLQAARRAPANALFVVANAAALPRELDGRAASLSINFPWGSLLEGLLSGEAGLLAGLERLAQPGAALDVRLNAGALAEAGYTLEDGACAVSDMLRGCGFAVHPPRVMTARDLAACPTTWAKRLAYGRDPRAVYLCAKRVF